MRKFYTIEGLEKEIARLEKKFEYLERLVNQPGVAVGSFITGRSNRPKSLDRMLERENNRASKNWQEYRKVKSELEFARQRRDSFRAREIHINGQPRKDAPSRIRWEQQEKTASELYGDFLRATLKAPVEMALTCNGSHITIKRINQKSVTTVSGTKWSLLDVTLFNAEGNPMTPQELKAAIVAWKNSLQENSQCKP